LNELCMVSWFSNAMKSSLSWFSWIVAFIILIVLYYASLYFFASATAHISAMYSAFLAFVVAAGAPPLLAALSLAFISNLF
ncbi:anion permease, partial [Bacillus subtilis]